MKFNIGDRVRVVASFSRHRGEVTTVVATKHGLNIMFPNGDLRPANQTIYQTDLRLGAGHAAGSGNCWFIGDDLEPYYDGNERVSWSECAWKPSSITAC